MQFYAVQELCTVVRQNVWTNRQNTPKVAQFGMTGTQSLNGNTSSIFARKIHNHVEFII